MCIELVLIIIGKNYKHYSSELVGSQHVPGAVQLGIPDILRQKRYVILIIIVDFRI